MAIIGTQVTFDGSLLNNYFYIVNFQGLGMPSTRDHELQLTNANGSFYDSTNLESRVITLTCAMIPGSGTTIYQKLDQIKTILAPWKGEKQLTLNHYTDRYIMARYSGAMDIEQIGQLQNFPISFRCSDPLWYANSETSVTLTGSNVITNIGTWPTRKVTVQIGINSGITLTLANTTTGKNLVLKNTDGANREVKIDFANATITSVDGLTSYAKYYVSGEFFTLQPGNNTITYTNASTSYGKTLKFRSAWI